jgi:solute carrier family 10 (sodium/bile acid cotransporter), member 7
MAVHLLVLATTFVVFPVLGLAARGLVPWLLNIDLYNGLLFLCLVPSTVQSSIAFTSVARGNVSAAVRDNRAPAAAAVRARPIAAAVDRWLDCASFATDQSRRPRLDPADRLHSVLNGHGGTFWLSVDPWQLVAVAVVDTALLVAVLVFTWLIGQLTGLDRGDRTVLLFCGSKKSLASGLPMAPVLFPPATVGVIMLPLMIFHQIQLVVCSLIASRLSRDRAPA